MTIVIGLSIGFTAANFIWQVFRKEYNWKKAAERSYLQVFAIIITYYALYLSEY